MSNEKNIAGSTHEMLIHTFGKETLTLAACIIDIPEIHHRTTHIVFCNKLHLLGYQSWVHNSVLTSHCFFYKTIGGFPQSKQNG